MPDDGPRRDRLVPVSRVRAMGTVVVVSGLFFVAMIAAAVQGRPVLPPATATPESPSIPPEALTPPPETPMPWQIEQPTSSVWTDIVSFMLLALLILFAVAGVVWLTVVVVRALMAAWRDRPLRRADAGEVGVILSDLAAPAAEPEVETAVIQRGVAGALRQIDERAIASDAIIAAWVGLEESAADAGIRRAASETPGEFALRIISRRDGIAADAENLLRLYERVRFGGRIADEADRRTAKAALLRIEEGWR